MPGEPILSKHPPDPRRDYKPMTWERFLLLRAWAKFVAWHEGCTVALVGSVLEKTVPRDIDVALIWPLAEFEQLFGPLPTDPFDRTGRPQTRAFDDKKTSLWISGNKAAGFVTRIDVRLCPDTWWPEKDRLVLASPGGPEPPGRWGDVEFAILPVVRKGDPGWEEGAE